MEFEELLQYARTYDKKAMMDIIEMYRPLLISQAIINEKFDEDLYQEWKETARVRRVIEVTDAYIKFETDRIRYCIDFGMVEDNAMPIAA